MGLEPTFQRLAVYSTMADVVVESVPLTRKVAERYGLLAIVDEAGPLPVQWVNHSADRVLLIGSPDDPYVEFPSIWKDEEFEDDLPPFRD